MKALVKTKPGPGHLELLEVPDPEVSPGKVKVRVEWAGICGSDIHVLHDKLPHKPPVILGHELAGTVTEVAEDVQSVQVGQHVTVLPSAAVTCGRCRYCRTGYYTMCPTRLGMGYGVDGAFSDYVVVRDEQVYVLPDGVGTDVGALSEPLACAVHASHELARLSPGDVVLVSGPGPIGQLVALLAKLSGAQVIVCGIGSDRERLRTSQRLGIDRTVDVGDEDIIGVIHSLTHGEGADVVFECAGAAPSVNQCVKAVRALGTYVQVGIMGRPVEMDLDQILRKEARLLGSYGHVWDTWDRVMRLLPTIRDQLREIAADRLPLAEWEEGFRRVEAQQGLKVLLRPNAE